MVITNMRTANPRESNRMINNNIAWLQWLDDEISHWTVKTILSVLIYDLNKM